MIADEDAYEDADVPLGAEEDNMWPDTPTEHIKNILVEDVMSPTPLDVLNEKGEFLTVGNQVFGVFKGHTTLTVSLCLC